MRTRNGFMKTVGMETWVKSALILLFVQGMYLQHNLGYADNGDYTRSMGGFTSGPIGIEPNWPPGGTETWNKRFFMYWIPYWHLDWKFSPPKTAAFLLWLPGVALNYFLYSKTVLYLPLVSLFPKLILFGMLLLLFKWVDTQTNHKVLVLLSLGIPFVLLLTATDYLAFFNSFYQESGSVVFLFLFLSSLIYLKRHPKYISLLCSLASIVLLATAKATYCYWPSLAIPFVVGVWYFEKGIKWYKALGSCVLLVLMLTFASIWATHTEDYKFQTYSSLFYGVLTFSDDPSRHLHRLGMDNAAGEAGIPPFTPLREEFTNKYQDKMSFLNSAVVIYNEPAVLLRAIKHVLYNMQDASLEYLGKYSPDDPLSAERLKIISMPEAERDTIMRKSQEIRVWLDAGETKPLNLWAALKYKFFPTGYALAIAMALYACWFIFSLWQTGLNQELSMIGLLTTITCGVDMLVAILGAGKYELIKHLFLANVLFDVATIVFVNSVLLLCLNRFTKKSYAIESMP
jgi:hypothetical protein